MLEHLECCGRKGTTDAHEPLENVINFSFHLKTFQDTRIHLSEIHLRMMSLWVSWIFEIDFINQTVRTEEGK